MYAQKRVHVHPIYQTVQIFRARQTKWRETFNGRSTACWLAIKTTLPEIFFIHFHISHILQIIVSVFHFDQFQTKIAIKHLIIEWKPVSNFLKFFEGDKNGIKKICIFRRAKEKRLKKDAGRTRWSQYFRSIKSNGAGGHSPRHDKLLDKDELKVDLDSSFGHHGNVSSQKKKDKKTFKKILKHFYKREKKWGEKLLNRKKSGFLVKYENAFLR